ncbi:ABC transporter [Streptomyces sp. SAJ15]|uniref:ABC transporter n=1 Tax=Streptomyces sp. SAJ15 TaxID=2011095 RepID=UPI0037D9F357
MTASLPVLVHYQAALLARSYRWLAPLLLYCVFLVVGVRTGEPILDSLGGAAAALLPVSAWLVRVCLGNEPLAARDCATAAAGPVRVQLACLITALGSALGLGTVGTLLVAAFSDPRSSDLRVDVPLGEATAAGLLAAVACALLGTALGALCGPPLLHSPAWAVPATACGALLALVVGGSPANAAVSALVSGSHSGTVAAPLWPLAGAAVLTAAVVGLSCALRARWTPRL